MRIAVAAVVAAVAAAGLAFSADAAPAGKKQKYAATKQKADAARPSRNRGEQFGYDATPEHHPVGSSQWWRAMEKEGRGGFGDTM